MSTLASPTTTASRVPSLGWLVAWNAARRPEEPALCTPDGPSIDHATLARRVGALAARLRQVGVAPGEPVAILVSGVADHLVATLAVSTVAAVAAPLDPERPDGELAAAVDRLGAQRALADHGNGGRLRIERIAVGVPVAGAPLHVADATLDAVQRWVPSRGGDGPPVAITNGAALWAQHAAIRELDLRAGDAVRVQDVGALVARLDVDVLATLAAGGTIVGGAGGSTAARALPETVVADAVVGPIATRRSGSATLRLAADLDGRVEADGTLAVRGPRSVGHGPDAWVSTGVAVAAQPDGRIALAGDARTAA